MHFLMRRLKRKHDASWVDVRWLEPYGTATWVVACHVSHGQRSTGYYELSRSTWFVLALLRAFTTPRTITPHTQAGGG